MLIRFCLTMHSVASHYGSFLAVSCISKISIACVNLRFCSENGRLIRYDEHPIYGFREMLFSQLNERHEKLQSDCWSKHIAQFAQIPIVCRDVRQAMHAVAEI